MLVRQRPDDSAWGRGGTQTCRNKCNYRIATDTLCSQCQQILPKQILHINIHYVWCSSRDSSVGTATTLRAGRSGVRIPVGAIFSAPVQTSWGPPSLLYNGYWVFPGGKAAGAWRWPPTPSSAEAKERVGLYLYSPSGSSWPVLGWTLCVVWVCHSPLAFI